MKITLDPALPIAARADEIATAISNHQVIVVAGETGSGKTTQLPKIAYRCGRRRIAHTQPRRIAARSVAKRIAEECEVELGRQVGYAVRFDDQSSAETNIRLMTDGLLLSEIHHDRLLRAYDTIIIDEAHERSLAIDFLLGYLATILPRRPDLLLIVTSATIDVEKFSEAFANAPVVEVSGRSFGVEVRYRPLAAGDDITDAVVAAIAELPVGPDILVFATGERDIADTAEVLAAQNYPQTEILPLYGRLSVAEQQKVFSQHRGRRIVLATNVAETSLTVPGIRFVIDPGLARISRYNRRSKVQQLPIEPISKASAAQRAGRSGRVAAGICIRLYSQEDFEARPDFTEPEIQRTNLAAVQLHMAALELGGMNEFGFIDPPDRRAVTDAQRLLTELGAMDGARLTRLGRKMAAIPADPRLARMLLAADRLGCLADVLIIVSALSIQDPRERPLDQQQNADEKHRRFSDSTSDFVSFRMLWDYVHEQRSQRGSSAFRRQCRDEFLHFLRLREWHDVHAQLTRTVRDLGMEVGTPGAHSDHIHRALLSGLLSNIGVRAADGRQFRGTRGARFVIFPGSGLAGKPPAFVMAAELVETSRVWARTAAAIDPAWVEAAAPRLVTREYGDPYWSSRRGAAMALEKVSLFGVPLISDRAVNLGSVDPDLAREMFIRHALVDGKWGSSHRFIAHNQLILDSVADADARMRRASGVDEEVLFGFFDARIPAEVTSVRHFDAWWKEARRVQPDVLNLTEESLGAHELDRQAFPDVWTSQGAEFAVSYTFEPGTPSDGVTVELPVSNIMTVRDADFLWGISGHRVELVEALIRSLPKAVRRNFVPARQMAERVAEKLDSEAADFLTELASRLRDAASVRVEAGDFDMSAVPDHLRVTFRIVAAGEELAVGKDLQQLRDQVRLHVQAELASIASAVEAEGLTRFDIDELPESITAGQAVGYPAFVDTYDSVAIRVFDSPIDRDVANRRGQARLLSLVIPSAVPAIGRTLDLPTRLLFSTAPDGDAATVVEQVYLAALDQLVEQCGPAKTQASFAELAKAVRQEAFELAVGATDSMADVLRRLGEVQPDNSAAGEDARVQLSWLIYPGFIRDTGLHRLKRMPLYLQALAALVRRQDDQRLPEVQDLEAQFHSRTANLSDLRRQATDVQDVRWALEELRVSLFAQRLRADRPISVQRMQVLIDDLPL